MNVSLSETISKEERKRQRLEAWRRKQELQQVQSRLTQSNDSASTTPSSAHPYRSVAPKIIISLGSTNTNNLMKKKTKRVKHHNALEEDDDESNEKNMDEKKRTILETNLSPNEDELQAPAAKRGRSRSGRRWDVPGKATHAGTTPPLDVKSTDGRDALDQFMENIEASVAAILQPDLSFASAQSSVIPAETHVITADQLTLEQKRHQDSSESVSDQQDEELARRALIEALKAAPSPSMVDTTALPSVDNMLMAHERPAQLAAEVKTEKSRREQQLRTLEQQATQARQSAEAAAAPSLGRLYNDTEDGIMEEAERSLQAAKAAPDALLVLAELNKKKELKAVDHSKIDYIPFQKNLYRVPRTLAALSHDEVLGRRAKLKIRVRGHGAPAPVESFAQCGLSDKILGILRKQGIEEPFPIQAQCIPCIMAGRDVIGIAKTGSGKTLAYLLPMLRHILAQPPLGPNESGPIGLILAPARELAFQIHIVCKSFAKQLGLKSTAVYGGAGVAEQIADLKRGTHVVVATPGRLIDILTMQSGKILSLERVTYVVADESDRMYDMGFAPQISAILAAIRPDRQTVLFSATFPKTVEALARKSLSYPIEIMVGGRSVASDNVTQYAELVEEDEKFLRLLQILGEQVEGTKKVLVFVDKQVRADSLFEQLLRNGYPSLSLHGGKEQEDRDSTIADFKRKDGPNVLVATGVAGRGLDVPACTCVINYSAPNHLEAYVHQVGRTGRAGNKGVAYSFVNSTEEAKFAPIVVRAMSEAGYAENISQALTDLSNKFKAMVEKGEAKFAGSGFKGKGYTYDSTELSEAQIMARLEKRQALIDAGMLDPEDAADEDAALMESTSRRDGTGGRKSNEEMNGKDDLANKELELEIPENLTPEILALPGMKEALLRKAGIIPPSDKHDDGDDGSFVGRSIKMGDNHWLYEFEINDYPREARWKVTQRETTSRLQDEFRAAVTLKGSYIAPGRSPGEGERRLYLHLEATSEVTLKKCVLEIQRLLNEETLRVGAKSSVGGSSHKYNVLG